MITFSGNKAKWYRFLLKFKNLKDNSGIYIGRGSRIANNTTIDNGTRFNGKVIIKGKGTCMIGKYVATGDQIKIITSNHETSSVILQYALSKKIGITPEVGEKINVTVGHNVWVGDNVLILPGVTVGDNSIIGAGSVVTKNVEPYAIVAGNPAKFIRYRFSPEKIKKLEQLEWHNWSKEKMKQNIQLLK